MKVTKILVLFLLIMATFLSACSKQEGYSIKICGFSDSIPEAKHTLEYKEWSKGYFSDPKAKKNIDITVNGNAIKAEYVDSEVKFYDYNTTHRYKDENGDYLEITTDGKLCSYFYGERTDTSDKIYTEDECIDIARNYLDDIVALDDYTVKSEFDANQNMYMISFTKSCDGFIYADRADFMVKNTGYIYSFSSEMLGQIPKNTVTEFDIETVKKQVRARLDTEYSEAKKLYDSVLFEDVCYTLTKIDGDRYAIVATVDVSCIRTSGDYDIIDSERIQLLIQ